VNTNRRLAVEKREREEAAAAQEVVRLRRVAQLSGGAVQQREEKG